jgi:hypothetical protein
MELDANVVLVKVGGKDQYFRSGRCVHALWLLPWMETGVLECGLTRTAALDSDRIAC